MRFHHFGALGAHMNRRTGTAPRVAILAAAVVLMALAVGLLMSAPGPVHGSSHEVPEKPSISAWDRLNEGLRVHWNAPNSDGGSRIIKYEVQYKESDQSEWLDRPYVGVASKATITGLVPGTEYQVRIRAVNANGAGPWSDTVKQTTRIITQAADPPDVTVIPRNRSLTVSFDPPAFTGLRNPTISAYNVQYATWDGTSYNFQDWTVNGSADFTGPFVTITGLENGQDYQVRVRAQNGNADGIWAVAQFGFPSPDTPFLKVERLVTGLEIPWDLAFTPDGTMLFTQRKGVLNARLTDGTVQAINADLDDVEAVSEGGLMSIAIDPSFSSNRRFYTCQTIDAVTKREVEVVAWTIDATYKNATRADDPLVGGIPGGHGQHNGCRLRFGPDGYLWITTGDAAGGTNPQSLSSLAGKVLRVDASDGSGADGNPFESAPLVYTYGHRNAQGLALRPDTRQMWVVEHGPRVDDEINLLQAGGNYGWDPVPADSNDPSYNQSVPMTDLDKYSDAVPAKWSSGSPTLATSGGIFLEGEQWGNWEGRLAVAALRDRELHLFDFNPDGEFQGRLSAPELELEGIRLRSPVMGPDGALYITTSQRSPSDLIYRVTAFTAPDRPAEVVVARGGDGELVAEWPAPSHDGGSAITGYQLRYSTDGTTWTEVSGTVTGKRWAVIDGLTNGDEYQVQTRALNEAGGGDWSPSGRGTPASPPVIRVEEVVTGVSKPWGLAFAPDGTMMFTERGGRLKVRLVDGTVRTVNADFTDIGANWETGLMGMVIDPDFGVNRNFYTCQGHQDPNTNATSIQIVKWSMNSDYTAATRVKDPLVGDVGIRIGSQWQHAGCRLRFGPQGHLWIATGDGFANKINPQDLTNLNGKMLRVDKNTGEGVPGNPFYDRDNANSKRVYTYGHRNPQGLARRPGANQMWSVEHGTNRDDEINLLAPGGNYGYAPQGHTECGPDDDIKTISPNVYCQYSPMTDLDRFPDAVAAKWSSGDSTLATSGGIFLEGEHWGAWEGRLAVATLRTRSVRLFNFTPEGSFVGQFEVPEMKPFNSRLRTPMMGTDGALYVTTSDNTPGDGNFQSNDETMDRILRVYAYDAQADATLTGLSLTGSDGNPVPLSPEFATGVLRYSAEVTGDVTGVLVAPAKSRTGATVTVNGNDPSTTVALDPGLNTIPVVVTAQDGATTRTYTIDATQTTSPAVSAAISDVTLVKTGAATSITLGDHFSDADGDALTYQATSGDPAKVTVSVDNAAGAMTVTGAAHGSAEVTVTATDDDGNSASDAFTVTVKAATVVASAIADVTGLATAATRDVSLSGVFTDADNDALTITAASSDESKATVSVAGDYSSLTVTGVGEGTATVTVTAEDSDGNLVSDAFDVTVVSGSVLPSNLTGLGITGTVTRGGETFTFPLISNPWFDPDTAAYTIRVPADLQSITFTPTWTGNEVAEVTLLERNSNAHSGQGSEIGQTSTSGSALTNSSNPKYPGIRVRNRTGSGTNDAFHYFNLQSVAAQPSFGGATVADQAFTAGASALRRGLTQDLALDLRLPKATVQFYSGVVTYTATGLPAGLSMGHDRLIRGTPEEATTSPAEVDYTATDGIGGSATLHFHVTVAPPLAFDAEQRQAFKDTIFEYTVGQAEPINATLPEATGGHGTLTYGLTYWAKEQRTVDGRQITGLAPKSINDDAPGFSFNAATRVLSSDTGMAAPSAKAFYSVDYWVEDENGARAIASNSIAVNEAPSLPEIADRSFTVGENVSVTLPKAEGGTQVGIGIRYRLEPAVAGLFFNGRQHLRSLTGRPTVPGTTELTYTATDRNNVSATRTFNVTVVNGPAAPTSAPTSVQAAQAYSGPDPNGSGAAAVWDTVSGATDYVVQVRADGGSYPDLKVNSAPADVNLNLPNVASGLVWINAISTGDYKVRVAARNADGVGPWSVEVGFAVSGTPPPQSGGQNPPCDTCGTEGDVGGVPAPQQGTPNRAPTVSAAIADATIVNESETRQVSLSEVFDDGDGDPLTITTASSNEAVATVSMAADNSSLTVNAQARGTAIITVTANDGNGGAVEDAFTVTVKAAPVVASALADVSGLEVGATQDISLLGVFRDADADALTVTAASSGEAKATVTVASDGSSLTLAGIAEGTATITVTAQDSDGNRVSDVFQAPVAKQYAALIAQMYQWREDPQWRHQKSHTDRWDRALLAFGETVADTTLTAMTAAEAQGYADTDWGERWAPVAKALRGIETGVQQQPNRAPTVSAPIADATIVNQSETRTVSLSGVFDDADADALTITAASSDGAVATVSVATDHSSLTVTARSRGTATLTVTADDGNGGTAEDSFTVAVKAAPVVATAIADMNLVAGDTREVSLSGVFRDADGDALTISADTSDSAVADVFLFQGTLTLIAVADGSATITVTAEDSDGNAVSDAFDVSVVGPPTPVSNLSCDATTEQVLFQWDEPEWSGAELYAYDYDLTRPDGRSQQVRLRGNPVVREKGDYRAGAEARITIKAVYETPDGEVSSAAETLTCTVAE